MENPNPSQLPLFCCRVDSRSPRQKGSGWVCPPSAFQQRHQRLRKTSLFAQGHPAGNRATVSWNQTARGTPAFRRTPSGDIKGLSECSGSLRRRAPWKWGGSFYPSQTRQENGVVAANDNRGKWGQAWALVLTWPHRQSLLLWSWTPRTEEEELLCQHPPLQSETRCGEAHVTSRDTTCVKLTEQSLVPARGKHFMRVTGHYLYLSLTGGSKSSQLHDPRTILHLFSHNQSLEGQGHVIAHSQGSI